MNRKIKVNREAKEKDRWTHTRTSTSLTVIIIAFSWQLNDVVSFTCRQIVFINNLVDEHSFLFFSYVKWDVFCNSYLIIKFRINRYVFTSIFTDDNRSRWWIESNWITIDCFLIDIEPFSIERLDAHILYRCLNAHGKSLYGHVKLDIDDLFYIFLFSCFFLLLIHKSSMKCVNDCVYWIVDNIWCEHYRRIDHSSLFVCVVLLFFLLFSVSSSHRHSCNEFVNNDTFVVDFNDYRLSRLQQYNTNDIHIMALHSRYIRTCIVTMWSNIEWFSHVDVFQVGQVRFLSNETDDIESMFIKGMLIYDGHEIIFWLI
jgi:hypothetical protein